MASAVGHAGVTFHCQRTAPSEAAKLTSRQKTSAPDGIECLNANAQLSGEQDNSLMIVNQVSGERTEFNLAG